MSWQLSRCDYVVQFGGASHVGNVRNNSPELIEPVDAALHPEQERLDL